MPTLSAAVNVSLRQFSNENPLRDIDEALSDSGMDPTLLQIEITESMVMVNVERAGRLFGAPRRAARDRRFRHRLFVDVGHEAVSGRHDQARSFVRELPQNAEDSAIAKVIISMGKALGLTIVAEGVETDELDEFLRAPPVLRFSLSRSSCPRDWKVRKILREATHASHVRP